MTRFTPADEIGADDHDAIADRVDRGVACLDYTVPRTAKPIDLQLIERAADLCAIAASTPGMLLSYGWTSIPDADQEVFDVVWGAVILAGLGRGMTNAERWAAGEAYLRCREHAALAASVRKYVGDREFLASHELRRLGVEVAS